MPASSDTPSIDGQRPVAAASRTRGDIAKHSAKATPMTISFTAVQKAHQTTDRVMQYIRNQMQSRQLPRDRCAIHHQTPYNHLCNLIRRLCALQRKLHRPRNLHPRARHGPQHRLEPFPGQSAQLALFRAFLFRVFGRVGRVEGGVARVVEMGGREWWEAIARIDGVFEEVVFG
jgi:hypothetical protein